MCDLALERLTVLGVRADVTGEGPGASELGRERVAVREDDAVVDVEVDITVGELDATELLAGVSVGDIDSLVGVRVLVGHLGHWGCSARGRGQIYGQPRMAPRRCGWCGRQHEGEWSRS